MDINELRDNIDRVDRQIVKLINERFEYVKGVGKWKENNKSAIYVPEREKSLLEKLDKINAEIGGALKEETLHAIYREIMSGAIALEHPVQVGYLGPEATFTQQAALAKFGRSIKYKPATSIAEVFTEVETNRVDYGCVPIENSTEGAVNYTLDRFVDSSAKICAEINMRIHHNLLAKCEKEQIKRVYSHAQPFGQCKKWIQANLHGIELIEVSSTSKAAQLAVEEEFSAAIASPLAAEVYDLNILAEHIEDNCDNTTRFFIIGNQTPQPTGDDKTSICFAIKDRIGALYDSLLPFKEKNITLTMIESRPSRKKNWQYCFFVDLLGHQSEKNVQEAIAELSDMCQFVKILGSYPRSTEIL